MVNLGVVGDGVSIVAGGDSHLETIAAKKPGLTRLRNNVACFSYLPEMVKISTALVLCVTLFSAACIGRRESSFFSNFSIRTLVEHNQSSAGLVCDPNGGGGGGEGGTNSGGFGLGRTRFSSHKGDSFVDAA